MLKKIKNKYFRILVFTLMTAGILYGTGRLYFRITHGFTESNITSDFAHDERWITHPLSLEEKHNLNHILNQKFYYLGKGCQSYVFRSDDDQFVLKFFKYQRYRVQPWLSYLSIFPYIDQYVHKKIEKKRNKREGFFNSWKIAFDHLQNETGLVYVHLNKTKDLNQNIEIYDKMGFVHHLQADQMEFLLQRKATMLCDYIQKLMLNKEMAEAKTLLDKTIAMILSENERGLADNDHALMQNTGVIDGNPVHIDVGQFVINDEIKDVKVRNQQLFNKTYKFRKWLRKEAPELANHLEVQLISLIGDSFFEMQPHFKPHG